MITGALENVVLAPRMRDQPPWAVGIIIALFWSAAFRRADKKFSLCTK